MESKTVFDEIKDMNLNEEAQDVLNAFLSKKGNNSEEIESFIKRFVGDYTYIGDTDQSRSGRAELVFKKLNDHVARPFVDEDEQKRFFFYVESPVENVDFVGYNALYRRENEYILTSRVLTVSRENGEIVGDRETFVVLSKDKDVAFYGEASGRKLETGIVYKDEKVISKPYTPLGLLARVDNACQMVNTKLANLYGDEKKEDLNELNNAIQKSICEGVTRPLFHRELLYFDNDPARLHPICECGDGYKVIVLDKMVGYGLGDEQVLVSHESEDGEIRHEDLVFRHGKFLGDNKEMATFDYIQILENEGK